MGFALSDMQLTSTAFDAGGLIPQRHSGEGVDTSPPLSWSGAPNDIDSFAVVCHDPDAPLVTPGHYGYVHWVLYGIPSDVNSLPEGVTEYVQGTNDFGTTTYGGPMPPEGHGIHQYYFWVMALKETPDLAPGLTLWDLLEQIEPHVVAMNRLVGRYRRD